MYVINAYVMNNYKNNMNTNKQTPIVASLNQKGGAGKTTENGITAEWFALVRNKKVLLVDLDLQCNTSDQWVGMEILPNVVGGQLPPRHPDYDPEYGINERSTIADIFFGEPVLPYDSWLQNVDVLCAHPHRLEEVNIAFTRSDGELDQRVHNRLSEFLQDPAIQEEYDLIILDTGPSRNPIFRATLRACTHILIPFRPEEKDIQGITAMLQIIRQENYSRPNDAPSLELIGLSPNMVRQTSQHESNLNLLSEKYSDEMFPKNAWLSLLTAFPERDIKDNKPRSVFELPPSSLARKQATNFAKHIEYKIFGEQHD